MAIGKRKIILILIIAVLVLAAAFILLRHLLPASLDKPESIAWNDSTGTFMVSNVGSGKILSLEEEGRYTVFAKGLKAPRGLKVVDELLYVTDDTSIVALDLKTGEQKANIPIKGAKMLNDIEKDHLGKLYLTDTKGNCVHVFDPGTNLTIKLSSPLLKAPNGIVYDGPRRQMFIVGLTEESPILALDVNTQSFSVFKNTLYNDLDGIAIDDLGRIYYSSWGEKCLFMIPQEQNRTLIWQSDLQSPADIYYHKPTNEILVPLMEKNQILRFKVD